MMPVFDHLYKSLRKHVQEEIQLPLTKWISTLEDTLEEVQLNKDKVFVIGARPELVSDFPQDLREEIFCGILIGEDWKYINCIVKPDGVERMKDLLELAKIELNIQKN